MGWCQTHYTLRATTLFITTSDIFIPNTFTVTVNQNECIVKQLQYFTVQSRTLGHDGSPICFGTCHLCFTAVARQQALYTMCSVQPAQHLHSLVQTKDRYLLRHRRLKCKRRRIIYKTNVTNGGVDAITWFVTQVAWYVTQVAWYVTQVAWYVTQVAFLVLS